MDQVTLIASLNLLTLMRTKQKMCQEKIFLLDDDKS